MQRGEWVSFGWSRSARFHRVIGFERDPTHHLHVFGDPMKYVRPVLACGKRVTTVREARPWHGEQHSYQRPDAEPPEREQCRTCRSSASTRGGSYPTDSAAERGVISWLGSLLGLAGLLGGSLAIGWLLSTALASVTDEEGGRGACESRGGQWMSEFDYIVEYEGRLPGRWEEPSFIESCYE